MFLNKNMGPLTDSWLRDVGDAFLTERGQAAARKKELRENPPPPPRAPAVEQGTPPAVGQSPPPVVEQMEESEGGEEEDDACSTSTSSGSSSAAPLLDPESLISDSSRKLRYVHPTTLFACRDAVQAWNDAYQTNPSLFTIPAEVEIVLGADGVEAKRFKPML